MNLIKSIRTQTFAEEIANASTHGIGILLSLCALTALLFSSIEQGEVKKILSSVLFGGALLLMYSASTFYHAVQNEQFKKFFKIIDHASIYLLIAGSYTPFLLVSMSGTLAWCFFIVVWSLAITGVIYKLFFVYHFPRTSTVIYLIMGWMALLLVKPLSQHLSTNGLWWLIGGGVSYSVGVGFYIWKRLYFSHMVWHLCVLAGSFCHYMAVQYHVILA